MPQKLDEYNQKRDFQKTGEPEGAEAQPQGHTRFVVQHHMARREHYDFRLEWDGVLLSWAVPKGPSFDPRDKRLAVRVEDHPLEYRNFEGTIPKGEYGGGTVLLWDEGHWEPQEDVDEGLRQGSIKFTLFGRRLKGRWALVRMKAKEGEAKENWLLLKEKDSYARDESGISDFTTSVRTGRTISEIERGEVEKFSKNPVDRVDVQLARLANAVPDGDDWLFEVKYDGYRILAFVEGSAARLITRGGNDFTHRFLTVADALARWADGRAMILDGEMVVTDAEGRPDFQALQRYMRSPEGRCPVYMAFDLLALDGEDLRGHALIRRKEALEALLQGAPENIQYSAHVRGNGAACLSAACGAGLEGIVGKKADSIYSGTRNGDWIKLKCGKRRDFVIGGYTTSDLRASGVSSLLVGYYAGDALIYAGRAGTGLSDADRKELEAAFVRLKRQDSPFNSPPKPRPNESVTWLEPEMVASVHFAEWTGDNLLRQASFKGIRTGVDPKAVRGDAQDEDAVHSEAEVERPTKASEKGVVVEGVAITNPGKVLFEDPVVTKEEVVRYYAQIAPRMLPYVARRVLSIVRCPRGVSEACFFKKHPGPGSKGVVTVPVPTSDGEVEEYFYIEDAAGLVSEAQMGTLEFHIWGSRVDALEMPDMMVFDLDPDEGMDLATVRRGVRDIKGVLDELSLTSYLKTSGGKGYHVVVPFTPAAPWDAFHDFARRVAEVMEQKWPDRYTANVRKASRKNRIFIDWIRNGRGATSIAPYSIRARRGARVSMPIHWDELDAIAPDGVTMADALSRMREKDPWQRFSEHHQLLK
jgi:bifunctional non-homologous end joining protein LigD